MRIEKQDDRRRLERRHRRPFFRFSRRSYVPIVVFPISRSRVKHERGPVVLVQRRQQRPQRSPVLRHAHAPAHVQRSQRPVTGPRQRVDKRARHVSVPVRAHYPQPRAPLRDRDEPDVRDRVTPRHVQVLQERAPLRDLRDGVVGDLLRAAHVQKRQLWVVPYKAMAGWCSKASGGVERRRGRGSKARAGRRDAPGKVLKDRRSPRRRGRMGTSV